MKRLTVLEQIRMNFACESCGGGDDPFMGGSLSRCGLSSEDLDYIYGTHYYGSNCGGSICGSVYPVSRC